MKITNTKTPTKSIGNASAVEPSRHPHLEVYVTPFNAHSIETEIADWVVRVSLRACQGVAVLEVTNDGSPIDAALMPHLFDPFRRGADATLPGLGLGLYIAHELVAAHDGSIEVDSGPRETTFRVRVPLTPDAKPASSEPRRVGLKRPRDTLRAS